MKDVHTYRDGYSPSERGIYGAFVSFVNVESGELRSESIIGCTAREAAREAAQACESWGPGWRIRCLSHPLTILRDLDNAGLERREAFQAEASLLGRKVYLLESEPQSSGRDVANPGRAEQRRRARQ